MLERKSGRTEPIKTLFLLTSMPVGGAETLLVDLVRRMDRRRFSPEIACLKDLGELGELMSHEVKTTCNYLTNKWDLRVLPRLANYLKQNRIDALVTVGAGDKMFWGRLAARLAGTPVVACALHSTGWPDGVGRMNRALTPITDAFIGVAEEHGRYLRDQEGFPPEKVNVIPNGVDTKRFQPDITANSIVRQELSIPIDAPVCSIVAALRPEKNHDLFLKGAALIRQRFPDTRFLIVGDGPERDRLEQLKAHLGLSEAVRFLGTRKDIPAILAASNVCALTSKMEANPVSILEALSTRVPVVATRVGSVPTTVIDNETGFLVPAGDEAAFADRVSQLLAQPAEAARMGRNGRDLVCKDWSVDAMVRGYENLILSIYQSKGLDVDFEMPDEDQMSESNSAGNADAEMLVG